MTTYSSKFYELRDIRKKDDVAHRHLKRGRNLVDHSFNIRIVNVKKIVKISRRWVEWLNNVGLVITRKIFHENSFIAEKKTNQLQEEHNLYPLEYQKFVCIT